jgi:hypothetical protein
MDLLLYEDEIRSVEGPDARRGSPEGTPVDNGRTSSLLLGTVTLRQFPPLELEQPLLIGPVGSDR